MQLPYYIDGDIKVTQSNAVSVQLPDLYHTDIQTFGRCTNLIYYA